MVIGRLRYSDTTSDKQFLSVEDKGQRKRQLEFSDYRKQVFWPVDAIQYTAKVRSPNLATKSVVRTALFTLAA